MSIMEFDSSKENIQPLRGGRNATQLEVALQAQTNEEFQHELQLQKENFENAIRNYIGDDPLENWYSFISWVEQSYPKHGHEGNLLPLIEECLAKFEHDKGYANDFRFCKLWIKYNDLQQNPIELFHMMHARGLCRGCADLYRAWAYYHEAAGDYRSADLVFQMGRRELAQPYEELVTAYESMVYAAGQQVISGVNQQRLLEQRQALTTLRTYRPGRVGSVRTISSTGAGVLHSSASTSKSNVQIPIYNDKNDSSLNRGPEAAPVSIISIAKRQVAPKENAIKPGVWTSAASICKGVGHREPTFRVHEDELDNNQGLNLHVDFYPVTHEDFSNLMLPLCYPEPDDPCRVPMYPKSKVYSGGNTEFSIEEIKSQRYFRKKNENRLNVSQVETAQAIQSILGEEPQVDGNLYYQHEHGENDVQIVYQEVEAADNRNLFQHVQGVPQEEHLQTTEFLSPHNHQVSIHRIKSAPNVHNQVTKQQIAQHNSLQNMQQYELPGKQSHVFGQSMVDGTSFNKTSLNKQKVAAALNESSQYGLTDELNVLWRSTHNDSLNDSVEVPKPQVSKFAIYEESSISSIQGHLQPKGSAMKSLPFKILSDEDLAETGSRGGHDIAAAAQPSDSAKRIAIFEDDSSPLSDSRPRNSSGLSDINPRYSQVFNFNLNAMQVSTPQPKYEEQPPTGLAANTDDSIELARKQLFEDFSDKKQMSIIYEETKSYGSSSSGSSSTLKQSNNMSIISHSKRDIMAAINEEENSYDFNLAQNLKANAALRTSILEQMDCDSAQSSPVKEMVISPLTQAPSDPFKSSLLTSLLNRIGFPGQHCSCYRPILHSPRLLVRKEVTDIGNDSYFVDKILGKGTYGQVFRATDAHSNRVVALKSQKPPNYWEFYICRELQSRLASHPLRDRFMDIEIGYYSDQLSVFVSEFSKYGSLLDAVNTYRQKGQKMHQKLCVYFCIEMLNIVAAMHKVQIIHADIKPDNFLVFVVGETLQLQLIDFGCSIDMKFFPPGTTFNRRVTTKDFICCEMQDGRPWNYHTDLFCIAATAHVLLFDKYMQLQKKDNIWSITQYMSRYYRLDIWNTFFNTLLNQPPEAADPEKLRAFLTEGLHSFGDLSMDLRQLINALKNR